MYREVHNMKYYSMTHTNFIMGISKGTWHACFRATTTKLRCNFDSITQWARH
jgi:hypothetical protein